MAAVQDETTTTWSAERKDCSSSSKRRHSSPVVSQPLRSTRSTACTSASVRSGSAKRIGGAGPLPPTPSGLDERRQELAGVAVRGLRHCLGSALHDDHAPAVAALRTEA